MNVLRIIFFILSSSFGLFALIVYTMVAHIICKKSIYKTSLFFKYFLIGYPMNFFTWLNSFLSMRIPQTTSCNGFMILFLKSIHRTIFLRIFHFAHYFFAGTQYFYSFLVSVDRFCALYFLPNSDWTWVHVVLTIIFLTGSAICGFLICYGNESFYRYNLYSDYFYIDTTMVNLKIVSFLIAGSILFQVRNKIYRVLASYLSLICFVNICFNVYFYRKLKTATMNRHSALSRNLFKVTYCSIFIDGFLTVLSIINWLISDLHFFEETPLAIEIVRILTWIASDILTWSPPFLLLVFCKTIRQPVQKMIPKIIWKPCPSVTPVAVLGFTNGNQNVQHFTQSFIIQ
ncbi:hypothetical protein CRE_08399 [Caenorhabditis remanei]|uniref:Serpentine receptor class gamma n=1 Tax=Caenorhabditis remanei TaxID=31234 RepID=E3MPI7_CAERE|nr:hypothetical protein CRE_08399 [Caenorhabditis remanei]